MPSAPRDYREVKLKHGENADRIKNLTQKKWKTACDRLGLDVFTQLGKGSHIAAFKPNCPPENRECLVLTIPSQPLPNYQRDLVKKLVLYGLQSGTYSEADVWKALGVK